MRGFLFCLLVLISGVAMSQTPSLKGGLTNFISQRLIYPQYSLQHCIQGKVNVGFKLNKKGEIYYTTVTKSVISELDEEARRLIKLSTKRWAVPAGYDTVSLLVVPVDFQLSNQDCNTVSKAQIELAIAHYNKDEQLEKSILNYYKALEKGLADQEDEPKFAAFKNNLGIDDGYLQDRIEIALKKIKQKDTEGACKDFNFVKYMGSSLADKYLEKYCK